MPDENQPANPASAVPNLAPSTPPTGTAPPGGTNNPIAATPPPPTAVGGAQGNTSGQGSGAVVPEEVKGWSWGAFFLNWIWGIGNSVWVGLLALVPYVGFIMSIVLGIKGREWAWQAKHWESVEQFKKTQHKWDLWGIIVVLVLIPVTIAILIIIVIVAINPAQRIKEAQEREQQLEQQKEPSQVKFQFDE
ncbi:MAG: hypothetical protein A2Z24_02455 [Candidatus Woykebacteria bacterium RBG_16_44_10]|uniref:Uncharacterized protein n=1 Tax=Candidatus Woykebacteria bacterium RBG_16_44_10 TaxID=1802597 RepID=A0A1G1WE30_9BACT|nr:MAG: hypothetical protein A2Z24_02455 [Candidatus Woykebacteria bacterium RBG_16_44_10]